MTEKEIDQTIYAVLAAVLTDDKDGLHELMAPLDRDELDFIVTGLHSAVAGFLVSIAREAGHDDPKAAALRVVQELALEVASEPDDL